jgi:ribosomal protein S6--L-glutamate ligase
MGWRSAAAKKVLVLGPDQGWHAQRLQQAAESFGYVLQWARYESLQGSVSSKVPNAVTCVSTREGQVISLQEVDWVLARTMPLGSLEQVNFRLSLLHAAEAAGTPVINSPGTLEIAIDKYRTLTRVAALGYPVPESRVVQTRADAIDAFRELGGDVIVKPLFGGEGRGVMRICDFELAWYCFTALEQMQAVLYVQKFVHPGGADTRLLIIGDEIIGLRRYAADGWKTNVAQGGRCEVHAHSAEQAALARTIADDLHLQIGTVDLLDCSSGPPVVVEVNAVPGWKGAEAALGFDIAHRMIAALP